MSPHPDSPRSCCLLLFKLSSPSFSFASAFTLFFIVTKDGAFVQCHNRWLHQGRSKLHLTCHFGSHNMTISVYWSPFLVKIENRALELVSSSGSLLGGCHYCPGLNHTEIGFYEVMRKALKNIIERKGAFAF
ncbi:hypothetical protein GQ457_03G025870 [Hibiscus cannabinus]